MGLALDEPREGDIQVPVDGIRVLMDPFTHKIITESGGLTIRSSIFGPTAELNASVKTSCGCS